MIAPVVKAHEALNFAADFGDEKLILSGAVGESLTGMKAQFRPVFVGDQFHLADGGKVFSRFDYNL
jgi:hypothetical protein